MRTHRILLTAAASVLAISACSSSDDTSSGAASDAPAVAPAAPAAQGAAEVQISNSRFDPVDLAVSAGDTVVFTNNDPFAHTVTSRDDSPMQFDSEQFSDGATFEVTFDEAGTFDYFCQIHPTMRASITVN